MRVRQDGLIFTNDNCIGCNKCLMGCPVPGANRAVSENGKNRIIVDDSKCIHCGHCLGACVHQAREYRDDTKAFVEDVKTENISVIFSPALFLSYPELVGKLANFLKSIGVKEVYDGSLGADISTWAGLKYFDRHPEGGVLTPSCPSIVNFAERFSKTMLEHLLPVQSPEVCLAIYIHKYLKKDEKIAFLGPCVAKKDEFMSKETKGEISYNLTFDHFAAVFSKEAFQNFSNEFDFEEGGLGRLYAIPSGTERNYHKFMPKEFFLSLENGVAKMPQRSYYERVIFDNEDAPYLTDIMGCEQGCIAGTGVDIYSLNTVKASKEAAEFYGRKTSQPNTYFSDSLSAEARKEAFYERFKELEPDMFYREFENKYQPKRKIPDTVIDEILTHMHKDTDIKRRIDCKTCGYKTCRQMAEAVALGYNRKENCVHYEKDENRRLYLTDIATGIPNSSYYNQRLNEIIKDDITGKYAAICLSLLEWELVNNRFGYSEGNRALVEFAKAANSIVDEGELVAHSGGVEFQAIIQKNHLNRFLEKIEQIKVHPNDGHKENEFPVSITAGIYMLQEYEHVVGDIVSRMEIAAKNAKSGTAKIVYYDQSMKEKLISAMEITKAFPTAIENKEFVVYFQPKVNIEKRVLVGTEALVRWKSKNGIISPGKFIPLFEQNDFIKQLDFYVLEGVCEQLRKWLDSGIKPVCVSSNFSKKHFVDNSIVDKIKNIVDKYNVPHEYIEIEVTETAYEDQREVLKQVLKQLRADGFSTSIDDFGSGYSSLNLLSNLDFQVLKLDKAFLDPGVGDEKVQNIVESVIKMAKKLNMKVVAEGVEREEELDMLQRFSCDIIQGYYFDRPMPAEEFVKRLVDESYYQI